MKKGTIVILVDHKWRDLPGYAYLKYYIEKNYGHKVWLIEKGQAYRLIPFRILPDMVLFIHLLNPNLHHYVNYLKDLGIIIGILPTEGMPQIRQELLAGKYADYSLADFHFVWSQTMKDIMLECKTMPEEKIFVCGCPRFDFYREPAYKCVMKKDDFAKKYNLNADKKTILFTTNFVRSFFLMNEERKKFYLNDSVLSEKGDKFSENALGYAEKDLESRNFYIDAFKSVCEKFKDINILIKPHPAEDVEFYQKLVSEINHPNLRLIFQEYIWDVLNFSDISVGRTCTTEVEGWFLNKPTINFQLNPTEYYYSPLQGKGSNVVRSYTEFVDTLTYYLNGNAVPPEMVQCRDEYIRNWCYKVDGHTIDRYAEVIDKFIQNQVSKPKKWYLHPLILCKSHKLVMYTANKFMGLSKSNSPAPKSDNSTKINFLGHHDKYITQQDVEDWDNKIKSCLS